MSDDRPGAFRTPKFLCDAMLGSQAKWLRLFGFDTLYLEPGPSDRVLAERARAEGRWLLTRDRELASVGPRTILIRAAVLEDQLTEVFLRLGLHPPATLESARCSQCNGELEEAQPSAVADVTPAYVIATSQRFKRCRGCDRVYWPGTHGEGILERMAAVVQQMENSSVVSDQ